MRALRLSSPPSESDGEREGVCAVEEGRVHMEEGVMEGGVEGK